MADASHIANDENENTDDRNSENSTYSVRKGTDNQGYVYEKRNMLGLYALRFSLNTDVKDVSIASNADGFEALDDMILRVEYHAEKTKLYAMQFKHKENEDYRISESKLKGNNEFSLEKYKKSHDFIKSTANKDDILMKDVDLDDVNMCIVTNAKLGNFETVSFDSVRCHLVHSSNQNAQEDLIDTKSKGFVTFRTNSSAEEDLDYSIFFRHFRFYGGQVNCQEAENEIAYLLKTSFGVTNPDVTNKLLRFIETWFKKHKKEEAKNKKEKRYILRKKDVKIKLLELLTGIADEEQLHKKYQIFEDITNVYDDDQKVKMLKTIDISLQGKPAISLHDLTKKSFHGIVPVSFLLKNINETIHVGSAVFKKPDNYIKRQFYKILLRKEILWKTTKMIFLLDTSLRADLKKKIKVLTDLEANNFLSCRFTDKNLAIIVPKNEFPETINYIKKHKDLTSFSVCHVKVHNGRYLEWQCSWSHPKDLNKFIVHKELIDELKVLEHFKSKIKVVSANAGMGKTTVLNSLAGYCKPNVLALRFDLSAHEKDLRDENSGLRQNPLKYIVERMQSGKNKDFEEILFNHLKEKNRLTLFIDGFDEISPTHSNAALTLIQELKKNQISMWVFTRPLAKFFLEKRFGLIAIDMAPLSNDDIKNYLMQTIGREKDEDMNSFLTSSILNLCNVPLYLHMLASVVKGKLENLHDLKTTDLYDSFIEMTYQKHMEKRNIDENISKSIDLLECYKPVYLKTHKTAALIVIFGEDYLLQEKILNEEDIKKIRDINIGKKNYELIVAVNDGTPIFSHRTYAEYFSALQIYEFLQKNEFYTLYELLFKEKFQAVRVMFDRITAETLPLHLAVVEKDLEKVNEALRYDSSRSKIFDADKFGRTVLHFAMNSCRYSDFKAEEGTVPIKIADSLMERLRNDEDIFKQRDSILNLNFYEHARKCENVSLFHLAACSGEINVLKCAIYMNGANIDDINKKSETGKTPIHCAAENGFLSVIKLLKENGGSIDDIGPDDWTALHYASYHEHEECVDFLIKEGAPVNQKAKDLCTPLHYAVETGNVKIIKLLQRKGGRNDDVDFEGLTPLHYAAECGQEESVHCLIKAGLDVNEKDNSGRTSLHLAAENGHVDIIELLIKKGGRIDDVDLEGLSPLHYASSNGFQDSVDYLTNEGANVNKKGRDGRTPMHCAAENGHVNIISLLDEKDGGIDDTDCEGLTALHYAALNGSKSVSEHIDVIVLLQKEGGKISDTDSEGLTALHYACDSGHEECVDYLLSQRADINKRTMHGETPMHCAAKNGHVDVIALLQEKGGEINDIDSEGWTALHYACDSGHEECVDYLLSHGADVNKKTDDCFTSMHFAAESGHVKVIRLLKEKRGNIDDSNVDELTPLHFAALSGHAHCLECLIELGADVNKKDINDKTPMHYAAASGHVNVIKLLSRQYEKIDIVDSEGLGPLHYAAVKGNIKCLDFLIEMGADVNLKAKDGHTAMLCSAVKGHVNAMKFLKQKGGNIKDINLSGETSLHYASSKGHAKCVEYLISEGLDVNQSTNSGRTAMFYAAEYDYPNVIKLLKESGAQTDSFTWDGLTVLHYAALIGSNHTLTYLLETGAQVNQQSWEGKTLVHYAAEGGHLDIIRLLKERDATIEAVDSNGLTALHHAAFNGHEDCINYLIKSGIDVNTKAEDGRTPLHFSAERGDVDVLNFLNERGGNIYETDSSGKLPLHYASQYGHVENVEYLLKESSQRNGKEKVGRANGSERDKLKKFHSYVNEKSLSGRTSMHYAASSGHLSIIKLLKEKGGIIDDTDCSGMTPLHHAVINGKSDCLIFLTKAGADINKETLYGSPVACVGITLDVHEESFIKTSTVNEPSNFLNGKNANELKGESDGGSPMHCTAEMGNVEVTTFSIEKGANVDQINSVGGTPLHLAAERAQLKCMEYLIQAGADVNKRTYHERTPMFYATRTDSPVAMELLKKFGGKIDDIDSAGYSVLHHAVINGNKYCIEYLLSKGAEVNRKGKDDKTPMHCAAENGRVDIIISLKEKGGRIDDVDINKLTPFHYAASQGSIPCLDYLFKASADVHQKTVDGKTPLHCAAENGHAEVITFLKEKNANVNELDSLGRTALHYATINGHVDCIKNLIKVGANVDQKTYDEDAIKLLKDEGSK